MIRKGYWKKSNSIIPSQQIIDPQVLLKKRLWKTQPPDYWSAKAKERKKILIYSATRFLIPKGYWEKTNSKIPSHQILIRKATEKKTILWYPASKLLIRRGCWKKTLKDPATRLLISMATEKTNNPLLPSQQIIDPQRLLKKNSERPNHEIIDQQKLLKENKF